MKKIMHTTVHEEVGIASHEAGLRMAPNVLSINFEVTSDTNEVSANPCSPVGMLIFTLFEFGSFYRELYRPQVAQTVPTVTRATVAGKNDHISFRSELNLMVKSVAIIFIRIAAQAK